MDGPQRKAATGRRKPNHSPFQIHPRGSVSSAPGDLYMIPSVTWYHLPDLSRDVGLLFQPGLVELRRPCDDHPSIRGGTLIIQLVEVELGRTDDTSRQGYCGTMVWRSEDGSNVYFILDDDPMWFQI